MYVLIPLKGFGVTSRQIHRLVDLDKNGLVGVWFIRWSTRVGDICWRCATLELLKDTIKVKFKSDTVFWRRMANDFRDLILYIT